MRYELFYWPEIQGRGEFVRLALEQAGAAYVDVARRSAKAGGGVPALLRLMEDEGVAHLPFAPPFLRAGKLLIAQTPNILAYLGEKHRLAPKDEAGRLWTQQLQLTILDFVNEIHGTHHPIAGSLYYRDQKREAKRYTQYFREERVPKFLGYFERVLARNPQGSRFLVGRRVTHADLSLFQVMAGLRYAFPRLMRANEADYPLIDALGARVAALPRMAAYLKSKRRIPFNTMGIFRRYRELDAV
jgi:glutathione S-transferase